MILFSSAPYLRQSILLSPYETPEMRSLFNRNLKNVAGKLKTERRWKAVVVPEGVVQVCNLESFSELSRVKLIALARTSRSLTVYLRGQKRTNDLSISRSRWMLILPCM